MRLRLYAVSCLVVLHLLIETCAADDGDGPLSYDPRCGMKTWSCTLADIKLFEYNNGKCARTDVSYGAISINDPRWPEYYQFLNCTKNLGKRADQVTNVYNALVPMLDGTVNYHYCESMRLVCRNWTTCPDVIPTGKCLNDRDDCYRFLVELPERSYSSFCWDEIFAADKKEMLLDFDHPIYEYVGWCTAEEMSVRRHLEFLSDTLETSKRGSAAREAFCGRVQKYLIFFPNTPAKEDMTILIDIAAYGAVAAMFLAIGGVAVWNYWSAGRLRDMDRKAGQVKRSQMRDHYNQKIKVYVEQHKKEKAGNENKEMLADDCDRLPGANAEQRTGKTNTKSGKGILKVKGKKSAKRSKTTTRRRTRSKNGKLSKSKGTTGKKRLIKRIKKRSTTTATGPSTAAKPSATATTGKKSAVKTPIVSKVSTAKAPTAKKGTKAKGKKQRTVKFCSKSAVAYRKVKAPKRRKGKNGKKGKRRVVKIVPAVPAVHPNAAEIQKKLVGTYRPPIYEEPIFEQRTQESERRSDGKREPVEQRTQQTTKRQPRTKTKKGKKQHGPKASKTKKVSGKSEILSERTAIGSETARDKSVSTKAKTPKKGKQTKRKNQEAPKKEKDQLSEKTAISQSRTGNAKSATKKKNKEKVIVKDKVGKNTEQGTPKRRKDVLSERTAIGSESRTARSKASKSRKNKDAPQKEKKELLSEKTAVESEARTSNKSKKVVARQQTKPAENRKAEEPLSEKTAVDSERADKAKALPKAKKEKPTPKKAAETVVAKPNVNEKKSAEKHKEVPKPKTDGPAVKKSAEGLKAVVKNAPAKQDNTKGKEEKKSAASTASKPKTGMNEATTPAPNTAKKPDNEKREAAKTKAAPVKKVDTSAI